MKYVDHYKSHSVPNDPIADVVTVVEQKYDSSNVISSGADAGGGKSAGMEGKIDSTVTQSNSHPLESEHYNAGDTSPISEFMDGTEGFPDPDIDTDALLSPKHCSDFFQSLELKSANEEAPPRPKIKAVQRLSILEDDNHAESLLPITAILSNLDFSSDDDEGNDILCIDRADSDDNDHWLTSSGDRSSLYPPQGHTGGKWKPGEGPRRRQPIAGKWKPGQQPAPACRKRAFNKTMNRMTRNQGGLAFHCNVCNADFNDRISYSLHFGQAKHKEIAEAKKNEMNDDLPQVKEVTNENLPENVNHKQEPLPTTAPQLLKNDDKRADDNFYCKVS